MIIRARSVVTMDGAPIEDGAVRVTGNRIGEVGEFPKFASDNDEILDLGECILLPGLINAHCHLDYTCLRGKIPRQKSFTNWIRAINAEKAGLTAQDYVASINAGLAEAYRFGTTTIANLTAFPELIASTDEAVQTWWFAELIDVREPKRANEIVDTAVESLKRAQQLGPGAARAIYRVHECVPPLPRNCPAGKYSADNAFGGIARRDGNVSRPFRPIV